MRTLLATRTSLPVLSCVLALSCLMLVAYPASAGSLENYCDLYVHFNTGCHGGHVRLYLNEVLQSQPSSCGEISEFAKNSSDTGYPIDERFGCGYVTSGNDFRSNTKQLTPHAFNHDVQGRQLWLAGYAYWY